MKISFVPAAILLVASASAHAETGFTAAEKAAAARLTVRDIAPHIGFLADDLLEGRSPGSRGERLATRYIAAQMESIGLVPGGEAGTFFQKVPLVALAPALPKSVTVVRPGGNVELALPTDLVVSAGTQQKSARIDGAPMVFVGYGIVAPEYQWDDYKDVDVKGKVVLVMNNDPESDPALFAGKTRLWYGRWDYKYLQAARKGAAGAIIIHTTPSAGYPWQVVSSSNTGERFELPAGDEPRLQAKMWATEEASRKLAPDLDQLRASAEKRDFKPVPLDGKFSVAFTTSLRQIAGENVIGVLRGKDPQLAREVVVFTAHHDHLGVKPAKDGGDGIYNGALDNASGVGLLLGLARAAAADRPKRSLLFVTVTAEEQGLLGSQYYTLHPTVPAGRIAANINMDSINIHGRTSDFGYVGFGKSSLDGIVEAVARAQGRKIHGDAFPDRGSFYRSDQFNFARIGVPALYGDGGPTYVGRPKEWGREQQELFEKTRYHQPSDEYEPTRWDLSGAIEDGQLLLITGLRIANDTKMPAWKAGDEFEAARKKALAAEKP
jgi:Zn-dependent M28 family amino/carboxypeptidase